MKFELSINRIKTIHELPDYWSDQDYRNLLEAFDLEDFSDVKSEELQGLLAMGISDLEPNESAEIILRYKLSEKLNEGQIDNLSYEMSDDKETKKYADISFHYPLFNINQLLFKAYNGVFTNEKASKIEFGLEFPDNPETPVTKELALKALSTALSDHNLILRLYEDRLEGEEEFPEAEHIIWELEKVDDNNYSVLTSDYWINRDDMVKNETSGKLHFFK